jgi:hypothetical protein
MSKTCSCHASAATAPPTPQPPPPAYEKVAAEPPAAHLPPVTAHTFKFFALFTLAATLIIIVEVCLVIGTGAMIKFLSSTDAITVLAGVEAIVKETGRAVACLYLETWKDIMTPFWFIMSGVDSANVLDVLRDIRNATTSPMCIY